MYLTQTVVVMGGEGGINQSLLIFRRYTGVIVAVCLVKTVMFYTAVQDSYSDKTMLQGTRTGIVCCGMCHLDGGGGDGGETIFLPNGPTWLGGIPRDFWHLLIQYSTIPDCRIFSFLSMLEHTYGPLKEFMCHYETQSFFFTTDFSFYLALL